MKYYIKPQNQDVGKMSRERAYIIGNICLQPSPFMEYVRALYHFSLFFICLVCTDLYLAMWQTLLVAYSKPFPY